MLFLCNYFLFVFCLNDKKITAFYCFFTISPSLRLVYNIRY